MQTTLKKIEKCIFDYHLHSLVSFDSECVEFGISTWNQDELSALLNLYNFDFVIGYVHFAGDYDQYYKEFWIHKGVDTVFEKHLLRTLECMKVKTISRCVLCKFL